MKFLIKSNGKINDVKIEKTAIGDLYSVEIDFTPPTFYSDLEFWLADSETDKFLDYGKMVLSKRNKMKFYKS